MALVAAKCTQCGANIKVDDTHDAGICEFCGTPFVTEKVINNSYTVNVNNIANANVVIDDGLDIDKAYASARRLMKACDYDGALSYYSRIFDKDPDSWEAYFYCNYLKNARCSRGEVDDAVASMVLCLDAVLEMLKTGEADKEQTGKALKEIADRYYIAAGRLHDLVLTPDESAGSMPITEMSGHIKATAMSCLYVATLEYMVGDKMKIAFPWIAQSDPDILIKAWSRGVTYHRDCLKALPNRQEGVAITNQYEEKVRALDPSHEFEKLSESSGGCYVATCVYGSYDCPPVWALRRFRDDYLDQTKAGKLFIKTYYAISPSLVDHLGGYAWFRSLCKKLLDRLVAYLRAEGVKDAPYCDKY